MDYKMFSLIALVTVICFIESKVIELQADQSKCGVGTPREGGCPQWDALEIVDMPGYDVTDCEEWCKYNPACGGFVVRKDRVHCYLVQPGCTQGGNKHIFRYYPYNRC